MEAAFMKRAIALANKGSGFVNPGPLSGAVIVKDNRVISEGYYKSFLADSAEKMAFDHCQEDPSGSEIYLNMEPFKTDSDFNFVNAAASYGIKKVYIGSLDPNPDKQQRSIDDLRDKGIAVELGVLKEECDELNEIYSHYVVHKTPFVITKWAMTLDGKIASRTGDSKWISSEKSLEFVHHLRQRVAAILVGEQTVKVDDPLLTTRLDGVDISNPLRVIISRYGDLPYSAKVLQVDEHTKTLIIASDQMPQEKASDFEGMGVQVIRLRETNGRLDFKEIVNVLGSMGIDSLYIEGGGSILASAFESRIVHKVYAAVAPKIIGGRLAVTPVGGTGIEKMNDAIVLKKVSHEIVGCDVIIKGYIE